jgi:cation diffusion facilitator CzcD-associated flavoprotein CzcO
MIQRTQETSMRRERAVVIGAGPAGLAVAAELGRRGAPVVVLERGPAVGAAWRGRYDRLRLNSGRPFSRLPGARFPKGTPIFPARDQVVRHLDDYAAARGIDVRVDTPVERIERDGEGWLVHTATGAIPAEHVIVATGYAHTPLMPSWPGREAFPGPILHSAEYRNPEPYRDRDVLVVGAGSSAMEIAYELAADGARRVRLAVRTSPNILLRSPIGSVLGRAILSLPPHRADAIMRAAQRKAVGDLSAYGLPFPEEGMASRHRRLGVAPAIVDATTIEAIKDGRIGVVAGVERVGADGVELVDGTRLRPDAIIAATGYSTGLEPMVGHLGVLDERGIPSVVQGEAAPGLRFVGYMPRPGQLGRLGEEARNAAKALARARRLRAGERHKPLGAPASQAA